MSVLLLNNADVAKAIDIPDATLQMVNVMQEAFIAIAADPDGRAPMVVPSLTTPRVFAVMGSVPSMGILGGAIHVRPRPRVGKPPHCSYKLVFDAESLDLVCLLEDDAVHKMVAGAQTGVAARWLSPADAATLGVIGAGPVARSCVTAVCAIRPIESAWVFDLERDRSEAFAAEASRALGIDAIAVDSSEKAVREAAIVVCGTNTQLLGGPPVLEANWLSPGTLLSTISPGEVDKTTVRAARVVPASLSDLLSITPPWEPFVSMYREGSIAIDTDLANIVSGKAPGWRNAEEITIYTGASISTQHAAIAGWVWRQAQAKPELGQVWEQD